MTPTEIPDQALDPEIAKQWVRDNPREAADVLADVGALAPIEGMYWDPRPDGGWYTTFGRSDGPTRPSDVPVIRLVLPEENNDA